MYIVVSKWSVKDNQVEEFERRSRLMRDGLRDIPEIKFLEGFLSDNGGGVAVIGYSDEDAYQRIINDENGPFAKLLAQHKLEEVSEWQWSERGTALFH